MEHKGSIEKIKLSIESHYKNELSKLETKNRNKTIQLKRKKSDIYKRLKKKIDTETEKGEKQAEIKSISKRALDEKIKLDEKRQKYIENILEDIKKRLKDIAESKEYIEWLEKNINRKKEIKIEASSKIYKKFFPEIDIELNNNIKGLRFYKDNILYDYTLDTLFESKKNILASKINELLFGEIDD